MTETFPSNNNEGVILNDAVQVSHTNPLHQQQPLGQQLQLQQQQSSTSSMGHPVANRYNSNKTESTTTITTNIATTPASTTASLHGDNKSDVDDDEDDDDEEDEQGVESEPNCGGDVSGGECDAHRNYDTISLTPSVGSAQRRRHYGHSHGHSHNHGHGHSHYFHHHNRHRRTPSSSSLASNTLRRGTHSSNGGGSGNCCDYLKVTVSDHQSPKIYVEKCCAGGPGPGAPSDNLDDEVERYFYVHQGTNHSSRKSSLAHGGAGTGSASQYGSHCSLNRSRCGSIRRRRSDHSITTTADVMTSGASGSRSTTPLIHRNSNERLRHMATRTMSPMMLEFHNSYQGASGCGTGGRARASSSGSAGSCHARDDDESGDYAEVRRAGVRIKCKHHSLEVSEDDIVLSLNEPGGGAESSCGANPMNNDNGRGSSTSLRHLLEHNNSSEIVILTPSKITIENYPMTVRVPKTAPTTPEYRGRREVVVSPLPDYATAPSPIHWHFPCSDSDGTGNSGATGTGEDTTTSTSTDDSHTVIHNYDQGKLNGRFFSARPETKTVSIWRTSENSDEETSAVIFHHESGTVENYSCNSNRSYIPGQVHNGSEGPSETLFEEPRKKENFGPVLNNTIGSVKEGQLKMSHNNAFITLSSVHDLSNEIRKFQKSSNFEPWTSNNLLSTLERNEGRRQQSGDVSYIDFDQPSTSRSRWNNHMPSSETMDFSSHQEDRFDLTSRIESFVRRFNKPSSIALTTLNRLSPTATGHLNTSGTSGRIRNRFGGIERRRRRRKHQRSQIQTIRRLLGGCSMADEENPHLLQTELDWINEDLMRNQAENRQGTGSEIDGNGRGGSARGLVMNIRTRVKRTIDSFKRKS